MTCHRRERITAQPMRNIFTAVRPSGAQLPGRGERLPVHLKPGFVRSHGGGAARRWCRPSAHRRAARPPWICAPARGAQLHGHGPIPAHPGRGPRAPASPLLVTPARAGAAGGRHRRHRQARRHEYGGQNLTGLARELLDPTRPPNDRDWPRPSTPMATAKACRAHRAWAILEPFSDAQAAPSRSCPPARALQKQHPAEDGTAAPCRRSRGT